jgi:hypothetical protein
MRSLALTLSLCALLISCDKDKDKSAPTTVEAKSEAVEPAAEAKPTAEAEQGGAKPPAPPTQAKDAGFAGTYTFKQTLQVLGEDDWEDAEFESCAWIEPENGQLKFDFVLWFTNAHSCSASGVANPTKEAQTWLYTEALEDNEHDCQLTFKVTGDKIIIEDVGEHCQTHYCGMRGHIGTTEFERSSLKAGKHCSIN